MHQGKNTPIITLKNIAFRYNQQRIIQDFSITIQSGEKLLISGPSGSGKTTFLKLIGGILSPTSGTILIGKSGVKELQRNRFALFGYHFVDGDFFEEMSTRENILMLANIMDTPIDTDWYEELLAFFEMDTYESARVNKLSAGQRERVSLIRALVHKPKILILDEPGSHLDEVLQTKLMEFIERYHRETNATILISSHGGFANSFFDTFIDFHADYHISIR